MPTLLRTFSSLLVVSGLAAIATTACSPNITLGSGSPTVSSNSPTPTALPTPIPSAQSPPQLSDVQIDIYQLGMDKAEGATNISQTAQSADDWQLAVKHLQQAISLLKQVPVAESKKKQVPAKLAELQAKLKNAQEQVSILGQKAPIIETQAKLPTFFRVPIKRRLGGIPVIEVFFNGGQKSEMMVDTGASGTVIVPELADTLGLVPVDKITAQTPGGRVTLFVTIVSSVQVGTAMRPNFPVAVSPHLDVGLLGHDFYEGYDITIKQNAIEFKKQVV